jgi:cysteinyl-tRNA synthetase, unknown class
MPLTGLIDLQGIDPAAVGAAPFDVKIVDLYDDSPNVVFTSAQVAQMQTGGGLVLAYMSIGEASNFRAYFSTLPKSVLGPQDPNWPGSYQVAYWTDAWKSVCTAYIDKMIAAGFNGAFFDVVDEYEQTWAQQTVPGGDAAAAMVNLVTYLADYARAKNPNFQIWVNGAEGLLTNGTYLQTISGQVAESLFYTGTAAEKRQPASGTSYVLKQLGTALAAGKPVIDVEYVSSASAIAYVHAQAAADGIGSYIAHPDLKGIDTDGILPGQTIGNPPSGTTGNPSSGTTYSLTGAPVTIAAGSGNDLFIALDATLISGDRLDAGGGTNTLQLSGAGTFDLRAPAQLANFEIVSAVEGQAAFGSTAEGRQTVYLRSGLDLVVNVASGTPNPSNPNQETITIYGANNNDVINLGTGSDIVVLGGTGETVNGGGGTALVQATTAVAGALVNGGSGKTTLEITNPGTAALNVATTNVTVKLDAAGNLTLSKMAFITAIGSSGADTITAEASGQTLTGGAGADTLVGYSGFGDTFKDTAAGLNGDTIKLFGGNDRLDITDLGFSPATKLTYTGNTSKGTLVLTDGIHSANITFTGSFAGRHFHMASDTLGGTLITYS